MVYLHARDERDQQLAANLDRMASRELRWSGIKAAATQSGTRGRKAAREGLSRSCVKGQLSWGFGSWSG
jgi:hypothetical protein